MDKERTNIANLQNAFNPKREANETDAQATRSMRCIFILMLILMIICKQFKRI